MGIAYTTKKNLSNLIGFFCDNSYSNQIVQQHAHIEPYYLYEVVLIPFGYRNGKSTWG